MATGSAPVTQADQLIPWQECLNAQSASGESCATACEFGDETTDPRNFSGALCQSIVDSLPAYADKPRACLDQLDHCFDVCGDYGWDSSFDELQYSIVWTCWASGLNGDCNTYAAQHADCGGDIDPESAGECELECLSTTGAFIDDTSDICEDDNYCDEFCDADIALAADACGALDASTKDCFVDWLDDHYAYFCDEVLESML